MCLWSHTVCLNKCEPKYICNCHQDVLVNERKFSFKLYIYKTLFVLGLASFVLVIIRDRMVVGFTTTCAISAYQKRGCDFNPRSWQDVLDTTLGDKVCQWLATCWWFSPGTPISSTNKTERQDIAEILLKVALNTILDNVFKVVITVADMCCSIIFF